MTNFTFEPNDALIVRVCNAQRKSIAPAAMRNGAKTKRNQHFRKNVSQSRKPKAKEKSIELSVER